MLNRFRGPLAAWRVARGRARFYRQFVSAGDLVFDIGANIGERTRIFRRLGARVVAIEPQPDLAHGLSGDFGDDDSVVVVAKAIGAVEGTAELRLNALGALSSLSTAWMESMERTGRLAELDSRWIGGCTVPVTTLDRLVEEFGVPAFCKVDVEGSEPEVFAGLSRPLRALSFEMAVPAMDLAVRSVHLLAERGATAFNVALQDARGFVWPEWQGPDEVVEYLESLTGHATWGDVYVRFPPEGTGRKPE